MRIEVTIAKSTSLPPGAMDALSDEFSRRIHRAFPDSNPGIHIRLAASNNLSVVGGLHEDKARISTILQETWESADDWFDAE